MKKYYLGGYNWNVRGSLQLIYEQANIRKPFQIKSINYSSMKILFSQFSTVPRVAPPPDCTNP
jgi:hypothetical protein